MNPLDLAAIRALTFDVFGTVVDWRGSIVREGEALAAARGLTVDWGRFADAWRAGYAPAMDRVRHADLPWTRLDPLHRMILDRLLEEFRIAGLTEAEKDHFNRAWHRLAPWPDAVAGLARLRRRYIVATLSNGPVALLVNMARHAGLAWDCILSAELSGHYKPDPQVYRMAVNLLDLPPAQVLMVAAHKDDLRAARREGLRTAFVRRPLEHGPEGRPDLAPDPAFDIVADDFHDLAQRLGA
ncbi:MAG: haloacid dehalogenase type II [Pseudomonadota bacterium]|nr:haloacid dehalogenase type II [Pseudomonadota bacterium]